MDDNDLGGQWARAADPNWEPPEDPVKAALRLHRRAILLLMEGSPADLIPTPGDPDGTPTYRATAVGRWLDEAAGLLGAK